MTIAIVGSGSVGRALGEAWGRAGHRILYAVRNSESAKAEWLKEAGFEARGLADAAEPAEIVLLAVPWTEIAAALEGLGSLDGKILIDATNPLTPDLEMGLGFDDSAGETVALLAQGARVVKAFNTTGAENMSRARDFPARPVMLVAGDDAEAKATVGKLAEEIGFEALDAGPLKASRYLEPIAVQWIKLASAGAGAGFAFSIVRR